IDRKGRAPAGRGGGGPAEGAGRKRGGESAATAGPGLGGSAMYEAVRHRLPDRAPARLFVDPPAIERLLAPAAPPPHPAHAPPHQPAEARIIAGVERYLAAVDYAGAALAWDADTIRVHWVETLDPARLDPWLRRWASDARPGNPRLGRVPSTAVALASMRVDP